MADEPFLSRWARRKRGAARADARAADPPRERGSAAQGGPVPGAAPSTGGAAMPDAPSTAVVAPTVAPTVAPSSMGVAGSVAAAPAASTHSGQARDAARPDPVAPPAPLPDPSSLTPASDFSPFMREGVDAVQRNAALRRLFTDPHFNTMDGLDVYIDDYGAPDPIPPAMLAALRHAHALLRREDDPAPAATGDADGAAGSGVVDIGSADAAPRVPGDGESAADQGAVPDVQVRGASRSDSSARGGASDAPDVQDGATADAPTQLPSRGPCGLPTGD